MKKAISTICVGLICLLSFYGCSDNNGGTVNESTAPVFADTTAYSSDTTAYTSEATTLSAEQATEETTTNAASDASATTASGEDGKDFDMTIGKIQSVSGNTVTVLLADTEGMFGENMPSGRFDPDNMPEDFDPKSFSGEMPEDFENFAGFFGSQGESSEGDLSSIIGNLFGSASDKGNIPEGFDPGNIPEDFAPEIFSGEMPEGFENFAGFSGTMSNFDISSLTYGTETKTYTIPEALKIGDGDYTSLKADDVIMISFDDEGGISEITVISA